MMIAAEMMHEAAVQPGLLDRGAMPGELPDEKNEAFWEAEDGGGDVDDVPHGQPGHQEEDDEDIAPGAYSCRAQPPQPALWKCTGSGI
ncbi:hypothetical protein JVT61DRAFT_8660 [Boletus reticuloceps]|uniref:Uncharacterized protein n=1 Tax=Boletus reticuloceps TaxID=495285 RepID=A0A8I2YXV4_9AGAM|nr:hypothetical protein JVT61DRAFT_8660 [Boletus reticuloceps]